MGDRGARAGADGEGAAVEKLVGRGYVLTLDLGLQRSPVHNTREVDMPRMNNQTDKLKETNNHKQGRSGGGTPTKTGPVISGIKHNGKKPGGK